MNNAACIFCLCETPDTKRYDAPCDCKPFVHQHCLNSWFINSPNECPICRINYEDLGISDDEDVLVVDDGNSLQEQRQRQQQQQQQQQRQQQQQQRCYRTVVILSKNFIAPVLISIVLLQIVFYR
jgi:hypothetical protein